MSSIYFRTSTRKVFSVLMKRRKFCWQLPFPEEEKKSQQNLSSPSSLVAVLPLKKTLFLFQKRRIRRLNEVLLRLEAIWNNEQEILLLFQQGFSSNSSQSTLIREGLFNRKMMRFSLSFNQWREFSLFGTSAAFFPSSENWLNFSSL